MESQIEYEETESPEPPHPSIHIHPDQRVMSSEWWVMESWFLKVCLPHKALTDRRSNTMQMDGQGQRFQKMVP